MEDRWLPGSDHRRYPHAMNQNLEQLKSEREWLFEFTLPTLFLLDVALQFFGMFVSCAEAWWIVWPFRILASTSAVLVVRLAYHKKHLVKETFRHQRILGSLLYLSCHVFQFFGPTELPLYLVAYVLFAAPMSFIFLFDGSLKWR